MTDYADLDATALAEQVRSSERSASELVDLAIDALETLDPKLNAVVHPMYEQARTAAAGELPDGPFRGVPMVVKDLDGFVKGVPYTMGSRFLLDFVPDHDATVIARLRKAGFVFVAKTNCPELGILGTTEPELRGPTHNPWNLDHSPSGSSGGSAAAVASRTVPVGHGGDGGGSIRIPASACGLFGLKTTRGRLPLGPTLGEGWGGFVQPGVITRSVRDSAAIYDVLAGPEPGAPYHAPPKVRPYAAAILADPKPLRIGFTTSSLYGKNTDPDCVDAINDTVKLLQELGHTVEEARPSFDRDAMVEAYLVQIAAGTAAEIVDAEHWLSRKATPKDFEPSTWFLNQLGHKLPAVALQRSRDTCHLAGFEVAKFFADYDLFLLPTLAHPPVRLGELALKSSERVGLALLRRLPVRAVLERVLADLADNSLERTPNTQLFNQTGNPGMSVPLWWGSRSGLPIGSQFVADFGDEDTLFALAGQLERARPWADRKPPTAI